MATLTSINGGKRGEQVAVLLNANAKSVNEKLRAEIARFVPERDVYYSRSLDDARQIVSTVIDRGYDTLLTGGGDGTFVGYVNEVMTQLDARGENRPMSRGGAVLKLQPQVGRLPKFGILRLGTGNALAGLVGASRRPVGVVEDILRARSGDVARTRSIHLVDAYGKLAPFAGLGLDAQVLNDYVGLKGLFEGTPLQTLGTGGLGYFMSISAKSVPALALQKTVNVVVYNEGGPARQIAPDGRHTGKAIAPGEVIYQGPVRFAAAGTVPYYGYNFTIFPHALRSPGQMHLRLTALSVPQVLSHLPEIWKGRTPAGMLDFHADRVRMVFERPMPFQVGGDAEGYRSEVTLGVGPRPVELLDFTARS